MKKGSFPPALIIFSVSLIIIGVLAYQYQHNPMTLNDNKSKLTILDNMKKTVQKVPVLKTIIKESIQKQQDLDQSLAASSASTDSPLLVQERVYTENEIREMTEVQFNELLKITKSKLPKISDIKKLPPGALHHTPELVIQAGRDLGLIKEILKIHEPFERNATAFYKECAKNNEGVTPVRALCLTNLVEIKKKNGENLNISEYPEQIIKLSRMVTDL